MTSLTLEQLLQLHVLVVEQTGGSQGVRDLGRLESVIASQRQQVFGDDLYEGAWMKAAALCRGIIADHPFVDGNKRTGILAGLVFLGVNDMKVTFEQGELEDFAVRVATDQLDVDTIATWLRNHAEEK